MTAVRRKSHSTRCPGPVDVWSSPSGRMEVQFCEECDGYAITVDGNRLKSYAGARSELPLIADRARRSPRVPAEELRLFARILAGDD